MLDPGATGALILGIDVGSTTVKTVAVDPSTRAILWSDYRRHESRQGAALEDQLEAFHGRFPELSPASMRAFLTGSGAVGLSPLLGARFVQEVNAVTLAVDILHPDVGSVIELGGQDAKIIIYKDNPGGDGRRVIASMNDKCASGTGATIDKCVSRIAVAADTITDLPWDPSKLHHVAAKCGVFAETDIVNLVKSGIPAPEVLCSLADAIVMQNLSVLTRGNLLRHRVLLLGGPNTYLRFLQDCWRQRIIELWEQRAYEWPREVPPAELVYLPPNSGLYAAYGAALFGLRQPDAVGRYRGTGPLREALHSGGASQRGRAAGPPLVTDPAERDAFIERYRIPRFVPARLEPGSRVRAYIGIDGGSTSSKAVLLGEDGTVLCKQYQLSRGNPLEDTREMLGNMSRYAAQQRATLDILGVGATGYAADILEHTLATDANIVETVAHMQAAVGYFDDVDVVCDVGGQDIKVLFMEQGRVKNFRLSNQCSAGNGMLLQAMASQFGIPIDDYADLAFEARLSPVFNYGCAVFLDTDRVTFQREGYSKAELLAGLALVLPKNIWQYVVQIPRLAQLGTVFVLQGGTQYNLAAVKAQHDYIHQRVPGARVHVHPHCGEAGAIGAALETRRVVSARGTSRFIGLEAATAITYTTRNDAGTVCHFCPNHCKRTFIETQTPRGAIRYIAGFSCENGTVASKDELKAIARHRKTLRAEYPNLVQYEAELAFRRFYTPEAAPAAAPPAGAPAARRPRAQLRIGIPRVLNMYSTGPLWRAYFEALGVPSANIVFSSFSSPDLWEAGGRYGSIDPCFPAKVAQAHVHELLATKHAEAPLDVIFFPCLTRLPSFVTGMRDSVVCPVVAGAPKVIRAAFTKERDYFARAGVDYADPALTLTEPQLFRQQMFESWGERLGISREESDFAVDQGQQALQLFDQEMQRRGAQILADLERTDRVGIVLLARPYHADPGLNHELLEEFQALGYPILSIRSLPKDPAWLARFFPGLAPGASPLSIGDAWPEAYSTNSAEKVWAAKFVARHPNLVALDLSSFKCGNDAPTYGMIDSIIAAGDTPYSALHDIDANKPGGSIKIRVRTYEYTLRRHSEQLQALAARRSELQRNVAQKRRELIDRQLAVLEIRPGRDERAARQRAAMDEAFADYQNRDREVQPARPPEPEVAGCAHREAAREIRVEWRPRSQRATAAATHQAGSAP